jgi:bacterioferritin
MRENWQYKHLAERAHKEAVAEMKHAELIIERILYLDGAPNMQKYMKINVGQDIPSQHRFDLDLEKDAVARLNRGVELARAKEDSGPRAPLEKILRDEEEHVD